MKGGWRNDMYGDGRKAFHKEREQTVTLRREGRGKESGGTCPGNHF